MKESTRNEGQFLDESPRWTPSPRARGRFAGAAAVFAMALSSGTGRAAPPEGARTGDVGDAADAARANPGRTECLAAHRAAQELRQGGKLVAAQQKLLICSSASCPGPIISDCGTWIGELEQATPTIVVEVEVDGKEGSDAKVFLDGQPIADRSHAIKVDPGRHIVRAELPPFEPHEESVFTTEGLRLHVVSIKFASPRPASPPPMSPPSAPPADAASSRPVPVLVYSLLGVGAAGIAGFAVFDGIGRSRQGDLEQQCAPHCSDADLGPMKTFYVIGDVSLGVGIAALIGSAVAYLTRPVEKSPAVPVVSLDVGPVGGGAARRNTSWGASATMTW